MTGEPAGQLDLELYDAAGALLAVAETDATNVDAAIANYYADQAGTFYVRVGGDGDYALTVNRNAAMDLEDNGGIDSAQPIQSARVNGRQWAIGYVGGDGSPDADTDFYAVTISSRSPLMVRAYAPRAKAGLNTLEPVIRVYDSDGNLLAGGDGSRVRYRPPRGEEGVYYIELAAADETSGEYVLAVKTHPQPSRPGNRGRRG